MSAANLLRFQLTRRMFLGGTAALGAVGVLSGGQALAEALPTRRLALHAAPTLSRTLPVDVTTGRITGPFQDAMAATAMVTGLGIRVVRDLIVPGNQQQSSMMQTWVDNDVRVIGVVGRAGDSEGQVQRRVRGAALHPDALTGVELHDASGVAPLSRDAEQLHYRLAGLQVHDKALSKGPAVPRADGSAAVVLRQWLSDLDVALTHPTRTTPAWPLFGAGGLVAAARGGAWKPSAGYHAISRLLALAGAHQGGPGTGEIPVLTVQATPGVQTLSWDLGRGKVLLVGWQAPGGFARGAELGVTLPTDARWQSYRPTRAGGRPRRQYGRMWRSRIGEEPLAVVIDTVGG